MIEIKRREECCGCYGCSNICPKQCISMQIDNEGFWYPNVDKSKCINCDLCIKVCQIYNDIPKQDHTPKAYACRNLNDKVRLESSSGGVFSLLAEEVIKNGGVVFGAAFDKKFNLVHTYIEKDMELFRFRGAKYVQSKIGDSYRNAKKFLDEGKIVLFSGTQCQIKGLNMFLMKSYKNLITIDIICHGVPSPKVFKNYRELLEKINSNKIINIKFRDKSKGWREYSYVAEFENGKVYSKTRHKDTFIKGFSNDLFLRPSCYECSAKNFTSGSDISLGDYWGVQVKHPKLDDDRGVSLVIINTPKGEAIFKKTFKRMNAYETDLNFAIKKNKCIVKSTKFNQKRTEFFNEYNGDNLEEMIKKYTKISFKNKLKKNIRIIIGRIKRKIINRYMRVRF